MPRRAANLKAINATLDLGNGLTITSLEAEVAAAQALLETYNIKLAEADAAKNTLQAKEKALQTLSKMPTIAQPGFKINTRQYIMQDFPFMIEFRVRNNVVEILAFLHQSRKIE